MSVTESQRLALYRAAQAALGEEEGDTLMALTPPSNTDIATRQDVAHAQALLKVDVAHAQALLKVDVAHAQALLKVDVEHAQALMSAQLGEMTGVLRAEIAEVKGVLQADIGRTESRMQTYVWKVVVGTGVALYLALAATMLAGFQFLS